jgi:hypothetical protein
LSAASSRPLELQRPAAVVQQGFEHAPFARVERLLEMHEMLEPNGDIGDRRFERVQLGP